MDVATGAMDSLLPKLSDLLSDEYKLQKHLRKEVSSLISEMGMLHAVLHKVAQVPRQQVREQVILWASEVRELSYKMEDIIDTLMVCEDGPEAITNSNKLRQFMEKMINMFRKGKTHHDISDAIKDITDQMKDVAARRNKYFLDSIVANPATATSAIDPRLLVLYKNQKELVGIEEARDELIKRLTDGNDDTFRQQLKIFSVFGFGGLGKTTLAKVVYDRLQADFDIGAFVLVGRNPDMKKVFRDILCQLDKPKYMASRAEMLDEEQLIQIIRGLLEDKRYIIVIDDIWHEVALKLIKCSLVCNDYGSRVIITTRIYSVAQLAIDVYKLKPLSCDNSERLLYTILFGAKGKCPNGQAGGVCRNILEKCEGVPSTILTIASLLASKPREDWLKVYNSVDFGYGDSEDVDNMRNIRLFSYYDLPTYLRTCLLYLSTSPKGKLISKDTLIWKWVAEGFIVKVKTGKTLFEAGEIYFNELINRSMIEPVEMYGGVIIGYRVYGSVLDIISFLSKEENFVTVLDSGKHHISSQSNARRLAVQNRVVEQHNSLINMRLSQVRSFNVTMCHISAMPSLSSFQVLRVLAIEDCTFVEGRTYQLEHLGGLLQLRYLGLLNMPIRKLPKEIGNLKFLQILDLRDTEIEILPRAVVLLRRLMCLRAEGGSITVPDGIGNLRSLEELRLNNVSSSPNFLEELRELTELRVLEIRIEGFDGSSIKTLVESLDNLHRIQVLKLMGELSNEEVNLDCFVPPRYLFHLHLEMECSGLPPWIHSSAVPHLSHLWVVVKAVQVQDVEILGKLSQLVSLTLLIPTVVNISLDVTGGGAFPNLRHCYISAPLRFLEGAMPSLESLKFVLQVRALKDTDFDFDDFGGLGNLPSLKKVMIQMDCLGANAMEVEATEAAVKHAVDIHPNSPILEFIKGQQTDGDQEKEQEATVL